VAETLVTRAIREEKNIGTLDRDPRAGGSGYTNEW
jgi:hypothetical protein